MTSYRVTIQVVEDDTSSAIGPVVDGLMRLSDPDDRRAFVTEFGWLGHDMLGELKRQWQITSTASEASASSPEPSSI